MQDDKKTAKPESGKRNNAVIPLAKNETNKRKIAENETNDFIKRTSNSIRETINGIVRLVDERKAPQAMELSVTEYFEEKLSSVFTP